MSAEIRRLLDDIAKLWASAERIAASGVDNDAVIPTLWRGKAIAYELVHKRLEALLTAAPAAPAQEERVQQELLYPVRQVWFRAGLLACREYMARFVEAESPTIANSIRANWWPSLGQDYGPPRQLMFTEVTEGEFGTAAFRCKTAEEVLPTQEALPIALGFLQQQEPGRVPLSSPPVVPEEESKTTTRKIL
jgi:hypothetical protein